MGRLSLANYLNRSFKFYKQQVRLYTRNIGYDIEYYFLFATRAPYIAVAHYVPWDWASIRDWVFYVAPSVERQNY